MITRNRDDNRNRDDDTVFRRVSALYQGCVVTARQAGRQAAEPLPHSRSTSHTRRDAKCRKNIPYYGHKSNDAWQYFGTLRMATLPFLNGRQTARGFKF